MNRLFVTVVLVVLSLPAWAQQKRRSQTATTRPQYLVETNPLSLLDGFINAEWQIPHRRNITFGPKAGIGSYGFVSITELGGFGYYYFDRIYHGWFAKGEANYYSIDLFGIQLSGIQVGVMGGYRWTWEKFTLGLGLGMQQFSINDDLGGNTFFLSSSLYGMLHTGMVF